MKIFFAVFFLFFSAGLFALPFFGGGKNSDSIFFEAMDSPVSIVSYGKNASRANGLAKKRILQIEDLISVTKSGSDIFRLNSAESFPVKIHQETFRILSFAREIYEKTSGALNPAIFPVVRAWGFTTEKYRVPNDEEISALLKKTDFSKVVLTSLTSAPVPLVASLSMQKGMMLDFGSLGKGFACDEAVKILKKSGVTSALLDLGGSIYVLGKKSDGSDWKVGIKNPLGEGVSLSLKVHDSAVVTSGCYERFFEEGGKRYGHIFDGKTGRPVENELASVTVVCESGLYADALSTALFVMGGSGAIDFWKANKNFGLVLIFKDGSKWLSPDLESNQ